MIAGAKEPRTSASGRKPRALPELRALEVFLAVCDAGSMTGGAVRLGLSQGAVSQHIAQLERLFKRKLFERNARELSLTPAGLALRHNTRRVLDEINSMQQAMRLFQGFTIPHLTIGIMEPLVDILAPTIMNVLNSTVERLQIRGGGSVNHQDALLSNKIDLIISADPPALDDLETHQLATDPMVLVVPRGFFDGRTVDLEEIAGTLPMAQHISRRIGRMIDRYLSRNAILVSRAFEFDHDRLMLDAVHRGQAWTITSPFSLLHVGTPDDTVDIHSLPQRVPERTIALTAKAGRFGTLPAAIASDSRSALHKALTERLSGIAPRTVSEIRILTATGTDVG